MGRYMVRSGASRLDVRDDRGAFVQRGVSPAEAFELVHQGCRFCEAGQNQTNDAVRFDRDPGSSADQSARGRRLSASEVLGRETTGDRHR
jgi:hypothetical protein